MRRPVRRFLAIVLVWLVGASPLDRAQAQERSVVLAQQHYDIPAQSLDDALAAFARISRVDIIYNHALADSRRSAAVSNDLTPQQALSTLLTGTGLAYRFTRPNAALIFAPEAGPGAGARSEDGPPVLMLNVMPVRASPLIGSTSAFDAYGQHVLAQLDKLLRPDATKQGRTYEAVIRLWVGEQGVVERADFQEGTGDPRMDQKILAKIVALRLDQAPPAALPQPLRFRLEAR